MLTAIQSAIATLPTQPITQAWAVNPAYRHQPKLGNLSLQGDDKFVLSSLEHLLHTQPVAGFDTWYHPAPHWLAKPTRTATVYIPSLSSNEPGKEQLAHALSQRSPQAVCARPYRDMPPPYPAPHQVAEALSVITLDGVTGVNELFKTVLTLMQRHKNRRLAHHIKSVQARPMVVDEAAWQTVITMTPSPNQARHIRTLGRLIWQDHTHIDGNPRIALPVLYKKA